MTIARGEESATYPARAMVVLAANPCPCGNFHAGGRLTLRCLESRRRNYQRKLSGPIVDRIDIWRELQPMAGRRADDRLAPPVDLGRRPGPGRGGPRAPGRALRRTGLAAQLRRARARC